MTITASVVAHSRVHGAPDLITLQCRYPRFVHAESKTHRIMNIDDAFYEFLQEISLMDDENLSRNASSSRALPTQKLIMSAIEDPAMPVAWHYNEPGMQGTTLMSEEDASEARALWLEARDHAVTVARRMLALKPHKQVINRLLEPFTHITVVVTATEWSNFFALRRHPDADPTMRALAEAMWDAIQASTPTEDGNWHLPYLQQSDWNWAWQQTLEGKSGEDGSQFHALAMISAARCARVSYLNHDGTAPDIDKDLALAKRLLESGHMSPFEHQGQAAEPAGAGGWHYEHLQGNFVGWNQFRKFLELRQ